MSKEKRFDDQIMDIIEKNITSDDQMAFFTSSTPGNEEFALMIKGDIKQLIQVFNTICNKDLMFVMALQTVLGIRFARDPQGYKAFIESVEMFKKQDPTAGMPDMKGRVN